MDQAQVDSVRRFNRTVTQRIGVLDDSFLARGRPLGQARVLWEIGPDGIRVRALRSRLGLDSGYLSRILRALEAAGLIAVGADEADKRVRAVRLTPAGVTERAELDRRSERIGRPRSCARSPAASASASPRPWTRPNGCLPRR